MATGTTTKTSTSSKTDDTKTHNQTQTRIGGWPRLPPYFYGASQKNKHRKNRAAPRSPAPPPATGKHARPPNSVATTTDDRLWRVVSSLLSYFFSLFVFFCGDFLKTVYIWSGYVFCSRARRVARNGVSATRRCII